MSSTPLNPSSAHSAGERARRELLAARTAVAELIGAMPEQVIFTSSGTEANNAVLCHGAVDGSILTTTIEHSSVLATAEWLESRGTRVYWIDPDSNGNISPEGVDEKLDQALQDGPVGLVSIQWVNNETGVIQPIEVISEACKARGISFHTDAAQAVGKIDVDVGILPIDFLTFTGHKFHAPTGTGVVYAKSTMRPWMHGGDQELGLRAGTENLIGIVGLGVAAAIRHQDLVKVSRALTALRDEFERTIMAKHPWIKVNGNTLRVGNTSNLQFGNIDGQALLAQLDSQGICVSQSSACTNQRPTPSHVLTAMGRSEAEAYASIRFSLGQTNTHMEVNETIVKLSGVLDRLAALEALI